MAYHSKTGQTVRTSIGKNKILDVFLFLYVQWESDKKHWGLRKPKAIQSWNFLKFVFGMKTWKQNGS